MLLFIHFVVPPQSSAVVEGVEKVIKIKRKDDNVSRRVKQGQGLIWQAHHLISLDGCAGKTITRVACEVFAVRMGGVLRHRTFLLIAGQADEGCLQY
jgi:hypothetical protein